MGLSYGENFIILTSTACAFCLSVVSLWLTRRTYNLGAYCVSVLFWWRR